MYYRRNLYRFFTLCKDTVRVDTIDVGTIGVCTIRKDTECVDTIDVDTIGVCTIRKDTVCVDTIDAIIMKYTQRHYKC